MTMEILLRQKVLVEEYLTWSIKSMNPRLVGKDSRMMEKKTLFTVGPLPGNKLEFPVVLENLSSNR